MVVCCGNRTGDEGTNWKRIWEEEYTENWWTGQGQQKRRNNDSHIPWATRVLFTELEKLEAKQVGIDQELSFARVMLQGAHKKANIVVELIGS